MGQNHQMQMCMPGNFVADLDNSPYYCQRLIKAMLPIRYNARSVSKLNDSFRCRPTLSYRHFSTSTRKPAKNRIFTPVRQPSELENYILSSTSARKPLITFWTASYCPTCKVVGPLIHDLIQSGVGESADEDSVMYVEVEFDSPDMMASDFGMRYMISSLPTLMSFDRGEVMTDTKVVDGKQLRSQSFLRDWIERESKRRGDGTGGGGGGGFFGRFFGN